MKDRLKQVRISLGYNQQDFAGKLGVEVNTYKGYEYKTKNLPDSLLANLVQIFNVNLNWLFTGMGEMFFVVSDNSLVKKDNSLLVSNLKTFYKRLNQIQAQNNLNDYQFSKILDISESRLEKLGIGKSLPTFEELNCIKNSFEVSLDWLLYGEVPSQSQSFNEDEIAILKKLAKNFNGIAPLNTTND